MQATCRTIGSNMIVLQRHELERKLQLQQGETWVLSLHPASCRHAIRSAGSSDTSVHHRYMQLGTLQWATTATQSTVTTSLVLNCRSIVWLTGSSSLLVVATPLPEQGGAVQEHRDMLYQLDITWAQDTQQPSVVISGAGA